MATLEHAQEALAVGRYAEAQAAFAALVAAGGGPEAQDGLGNALRWLGEFDACLEARERAHQGYLQRGDWAGAALVAAALAADSELLRGEHAVAQGWFGRARELLEDQPDAPAMAWVAVMQAEQRFLGAGDAGAALEAGEFAIEAGRRGGDVDLELLGRALRGLGRVATGDVAAGMRDLDEAAAVASAGGACSAITAAKLWCNLISACEAVRDLDRAAQWCEIVLAHAERLTIHQLFGYCRTHYAAMLTARGAWDEADRQLARATVDFAQGAPAAAFTAALGLAELRRRQGRLGEAAALCAIRAHHPVAQLCLAELAWDRGEERVAVELRERRRRRLADRGVAPDADCGDLELAVRLAAAAGKPDAAAAAADALAVLARSAGTPGLRAAAAFAAGLAASVRGAVSEAQASLEDAVDLGCAAGIPFDTARAELALARVHDAADRSEEAAALRSSATARLAALGRDASAGPLDALLDRVGAAAAPELSPREAEILGLVAEGLNDRDIAQRLIVSPHTVHRHVANIRAKLRAPSRAAAAAQAIRDGLI